MKRAFFASTVILATSISLLAQGPTPASDDNAVAPDAAAAPAVARISVINGVVSVRRGDSGEAVAAALNAPLTGTDRLLTGEGSRAEIQFDALNMIRLAPSTEVRLGELAYHRYQVQIATGTTVFRVMRDNDAEIEISTPSISVRPLKQGVYRITVNPDGTSQVTVRSGEVEISSPKGTEKLGQGKTMQARGTAGDPEFQVTGAIAADQWDKWNADRDHDLEKSGSGRYVNPDINGTEELDANGRWVNDPAYGQVWVPATVDPGWAPYRVGRWVWVNYYGWTWVSGDPCGWAPYHYGRWYMSSYGWAWWPGALYGPYYWQPALVGFFGWGGGFGVGFGFGNVGWVGLAPYERFYPGYGRGISAMNVVHNTNVTNVYRNARVSNGVTSMASSQFGRSGVTTGNYVHAGASDLARAASVRGAVPMAPSRESTHFSSSAASSAGMPHSSENSHFYSSHATSAAASNHTSFDQQRQAMARSAGNLAARSPAASTSSPAHVASSGSGVNPSTSTNSVSHPNRGTAASSGTAPQSGGWTRFNGNNSGVSSGAATAGRSAGGSSNTNGSLSSGASHSSAVRINPSVVQSRGSSGGSSSAPRGSGGSSSRSGGGGRR